jgi:hypothetical protein
MRRFCVVIALVAYPAFSQAQDAYKSKYVRIKINLNEYTVGTKGKIPYPKFGGMGVPGKFGGGPKFGPGQPPKKPVKETSKEPPVWVEVYLPIGSQPKTVGDKFGQYLEIAPYPDAIEGKVRVPKADIKVLEMRKPKWRFEDKKKVVYENASADGLVELATWALQHGLTKQFADTMNDFVKAFPNDPVAVAYVNVDKKLKSKPSADDPAAIKLKLSGYKPVVSPAGHYVMYTKTGADEWAVKARLAYLDAAYENFYYWFALHRKELPQPGHRLLVVLEPDAEEFRKDSHYYTEMPITDAGYLLKGLNVAFLSANPVSPVFTSLADNNTTLYQDLEVSKKSLLLGDILTGKVKAPKISSQDDLAKLATRTLVQTALEAESARESTTHEAIAQLVAASNLLPRNVRAAEWLRYGLASFFETPVRACDFTTTLPSTTNLISFRQFLKSRKPAVDEKDKTQSAFEAVKVQILFDTITDGYFRETFDLFRFVKAGKKSNDPVRLLAWKQLEIARATSWSVTYYLMDKHLDKIFTYCDYLKQLPRDIDYGAPVLASCFAKTFGWQVADPLDPASIDLQQLKDFAKKWDHYVAGLSLDIDGMEALVMESLAPPKK